MCSLCGEKILPQQDSVREIDYYFHLGCWMSYHEARRRGEPITLKGREHAMKCNRCYQDGADTFTKEGGREYHWHAECLEQGAAEMRRAEEIALRYGFSITPKNLARRTYQDNPAHFNR